ncbi:MAG TPA: biopolymer transporter ExbD [Burkholderiales bacterium]|nr:biopolymer transporter ExbD [Burkholderiales bacterium]
MAFGGFSQSADTAPTAEINMVPLIDVMLVLLVIFIITAPLLTHAVKIDLPKATSASNVTHENVQLAIRANGEVFWNGQAVEASQLASRMSAAARLDPQPELHLRADRTTPYEKVAQVLSAAAKAGLIKIGFVTEPPAGE